MSQTRYRQLEPYSAPEWASGLAIVPKARIPLAMVPTPIHQWEVPGVPSPFSVTVKRDDLTHCTLTGNKARKAEFLLADALDKGCDCIVTFGGVHSNHARVMSLAAREMGLDCVLFIQTHTDHSTPVEQVGCQGNMMLCRLTGATLITCPKKEGLPHYDDVARITKFMEAHVEKMRAEGRRPYMVPVGGTCPLGEWGYINAWEELRGQGALDDIDDVIVTCGSGGTTGGLSIANYLTGSKVKVHCVSISNRADSVYAGVRHQLDQFGLKRVEPRDILDVMDDYTLGGHGNFNKKLKELVVSVTSSTGIPIDTIYTGKTVWGMLTEMETNPRRFRGNRVLFIHTGGIFNTFNGILDDVVETTPSSCRIHAYQES